MKKDRNIFFIPGAHHTHKCFVETPDKRPGWSQLQDLGNNKCYLSDLPYKDKNATGSMVIKCLSNEVSKLGRITVVAHSMSGPYALKLAELYPEIIDRLVLIEPALPGNREFGEVHEADYEDDEIVKFRQGKLNYEVKKNELNFPTDSFINRLINSEQFPKDAESIERYKNSLVSLPPFLRLERFNIKGFEQIKINDSKKLRNCRILIVTSGNDQLHREQDILLKEILDKWGTEVRMINLEENGLKGNGHMMMLEKNNSEIWNLIRQEGLFI